MVQRISPLLKTLLQCVQMPGTSTFTGQCSLLGNWHRVQVTSPYWGYAWGNPKNNGVWLDKLIYNIVTSCYIFKRVRSCVTNNPFTNQNGHNSARIQVQVTISLLSNQDYPSWYTWISRNLSFPPTRDIHGATKKTFQVSLHRFKNNPLMGVSENFGEPPNYQKLCGTKWLSHTFMSLLEF